MRFSAGDWYPPPFSQTNPTIPQLTLSCPETLFLWNSPALQPACVQSIETGASLPHIGAVLGGRDHTTVLHGCERIAAMIEEDPDMRREVISLRQRLYAPVG
jgi:hypothetical protein